MGETDLIASKRLRYERPHSGSEVLLGDLRIMKVRAHRTQKGFRFGFTVFCTCKAQPKLIGWRHATREFNVLLLALTDGPSSFA
jgi:hypothetical protein